MAYSWQHVSTGQYKPKQSQKRVYLAQIRHFSRGFFCLVEPGRPIYTRKSISGTRNTRRFEFLILKSAINKIAHAKSSKTTQQMTTWTLHDKATTVHWDPSTSIVQVSNKNTQTHKRFKMPRSLENLEEYVDLPSNYKYAFRIQRDGKLKISAPLPDLGVTWSIQCAPLD